MATSTRAPKTITPEEREHYMRMIALLAEPSLKLTNVGGKEGEVPESSRPMMRHLAQFAAANEAIFLSGVDKALTTQQAADVLNVPHSHLIALLDKGTIPSTMVGSLHRIQYDDLMAFHAVWYAERKQILDELTREGEEMGGYDLPPRTFEFDYSA